MGRHEIHKLFFPVPHFPAFPFTLYMVITYNVREPMNKQGKESFIKICSRSPRFFFGPLQRNNDIAKHLTGQTIHIRKRYNVRRIVLSKKLLIQYRYLFVVNKKDT
jgi:hypothetical protein